MTLYTCKYCNAIFKYKKSHSTHEGYKCKVKNSIFTNEVKEGIHEIQKVTDYEKTIKKLKTIIMIQQNTITKILQQVTDGKVNTQ